MKIEEIAVDFKEYFRYNLTVKIYNFGGNFTMKKVLAVLLAVIMAFSAISLVALAEDTEEPATTADDTTNTTVIHYPDPEPTSNIVNPEGLVFPTNGTQLEMSFVFKIIERIINFFLGLFGEDVDANLTDSVADLGKWLDEAISNIQGSLN